MGRATWVRRRRRLALQRTLSPLVRELDNLRREVEDLESAPEDALEDIRRELGELDNRVLDLET